MQHKPRNQELHRKATRNPQLNQPSQFAQDRLPARRGFRRPRLCGPPLGGRGAARLQRRPAPPRPKRKPPPASGARKAETENCKTPPPGRPPRSAPPPGFPGDSGAAEAKGRSRDQPPRSAAMKPPRLPDLRKVLARLAAARADGGAPSLDEQELERSLRCRARQTRERRLRKLMGPPEPPERALTRRAMEQIRHLRRAFPEEWPLARLAQGFRVPPEVIGRVLRSRFCPSPERGRKQDARASRGTLGRAAPALPRAAGAPRLPAGTGKGR